MVSRERMEASMLLSLHFSLEFRRLCDRGVVLGAIGSDFNRGLFDLSDDHTILDDWSSPHSRCLLQKLSDLFAHVRGIERWPGTIAKNSMFRRGPSFWLHNVQRAAPRTVTAIILGPALLHVPGLYFIPHVYPGKTHHESGTLDDVVQINECIAGLLQITFSDGIDELLEFLVHELDTKVVGLLVQK